MNELHNKISLLAIVGPTASGKSELAVTLAKKFHGEIISCDSRQIYRGMDIGSGKVTGSWKLPGPASRKKNTAARSGDTGSAKPVFLYKGVAHYCIDAVSPRSQYSAARFQRQAKKAVLDIAGRGKLPILCGGTGHWADAVVWDQKLPEVKPNKKLRLKLERLSCEQLLARIRKHDTHRAKTIDPHNKRRLVRALEIILSTGKPVPTLPADPKPAYRTLWIGINPGKETLNKKIEMRLAQRVRLGMAAEIKKLRKTLSWKRLESFGLEYKFMSLYLQKKLSRHEALAQLTLAIQHYAKRQMTWFKKNRQIHWVQNETSARLLVEKFLT